MLHNATTYQIVGGTNTEVEVVLEPGETKTLYIPDEATLLCIQMLVSNGSTYSFFAAKTNGILERLYSSFRTQVINPYISGKNIILNGSNLDKASTGTLIYK